jgi:hypothetical protein
MASKIRKQFSLLRFVRFSPGLWCAALQASLTATAQEPLALENSRVGLKFDRNTGSMIAIQNKATGETYAVRNDSFEVEAREFHAGQADARLVSLEQQPGTVKARYETGPATVEATYTLRGNDHFAEKRLTLLGARNYGLRNLVISQPACSGEDLQIVAYHYPRINAYRKLLDLDEAPNRTFFLRTPKGGLMMGIESPFDTSTVIGQQVVLRYAPSLKVNAGDRLECEPVYFAVYQRGSQDDFQDGPHYANLWSDDKQQMPMRSESEAMVAMVASLFGGPRFGLVPIVNGWHSEWSRGAYTEKALADDLKAIEFAADCGIDWISEGHFWGGDQKRVAALGLEEKYEVGPLERKFIERARAAGMKVFLGSSPNDIYEGTSKRFCSPQADWMLDAGATPPGYAPKWRGAERGNCLANRPFFDWLTRVNLEGLAANFGAWEFDGDFFGTVGYASRVDCQSDLHDHLAGDSNYASQRAMDQLLATIRKRFPQTCINMYRPGADLGIWALKNVDVCFTILEDGLGMDDNIAGGDKVRTWSRVRVQREFLPHYIDQPLLFPVPASEHRKESNWPKGHLDYILLSALSSAPSQAFYLPAKTGIPAADKAEIHRWLDWGHRNIQYLNVRKDLPDWPAPGKVDGSAHILGDRGLIFLFNSGDAPLPGEFALTDDCLGLKSQGSFQLSQEYPPSERSLKSASGRTVRWEVPSRSAVVIKVQPAEARRSPPQ